ncbi:hypothetical protein [Halorubrum sp. FL23]|uniref:hypothetical protein n=1 Tax=Halorubrum sp. FL23 TaxID=3458704 RepID=UPI004034C8E8
MTLEQRHLHRFLTPLTAVDGPTELAIADDGLVAATVDDAMVTTVEATLHESLCDQYTVTPGTISLDPNALTDTLAAERRADEPARLTYDPDTTTLTLAVPSFVQSQQVDTDTTVGVPEVGDPPQGATTYHDADELTHAVDYFSDRSAVVALGYEEVDDVFYLEEVPAASTTSNTRYRRLRADLPGSVTPGSARSTFSVNALASVLEVVPPETVVRADYTDAFPIQIAWDLIGGDGICEGTLTEVTALIAPCETAGAPSTEDS